MHIIFKFAIEYLRLTRKLTNPIMNLNPFEKKKIVKTIKPNISPVNPSGRLNLFFSTFNYDLIKNIYVTYYTSHKYLLS